MIGLKDILLIKSKTSFPRMLRNFLVLCEEGKEKIALLDILTVILVRAIDRCCKGPLGRI